MDEEIKKLLEKNIKLSEEILEQTAKTRKYILFQQVYSAIKILIIVVPIILGIIYLPPLLQDLFNQYSSILGLGGKIQTIDQLSPELLKQLPAGILEQLSPELLKN